jgi:hypothetical protein
MERSLRVALVFVAVLTVATPSKASPSCMSMAEARKHFGSSHIYWHGPDHCWDATPSRQHGVHGVRRREPTREAERKAEPDRPDPAKPVLKPDPTPDRPKWRDSLSEMLSEPDSSAASQVARSDLTDADRAPPVSIGSGTNAAAHSEPSPNLASRWVDIVQVVPPVAQPALEPSAAPRGTLLPYAAIFILAAGFVVLLFSVSVRHRPRSPRSA